MWSVDLALNLSVIWLLYFIRMMILFIFLFISYVFHLYICIKSVLSCLFIIILLLLLFHRKFLTSYFFSFCITAAADVDATVVVSMCRRIASNIFELAGCKCKWIHILMWWLLSVFDVSFHFCFYNWISKTTNKNEKKTHNKILNTRFAHLSYTGLVILLPLNRR